MMKIALRKVLGEKTFFIFGGKSIILFIFADKFLNL